MVAIDDDESSHELVREALSLLELDVHVASTMAAGRCLMEQLSPRILVIDENLPDGHGLDLVQEVARRDPAVEIFVLTGEYSTELAVRAIKAGASDYLTKPITVDQLCGRIQPVVEEIQKRRAIAQADVQLSENFEFCGMLSRSPAMLDVFAKIQRVSRHYRAILVQGETGTGKELVARALHRSGVGDNRPFIACNCSAIPETLIERELFGHVKGAFTGAVSDSPGLFQAANGGTILLDEIGDMPLQQQGRLLRVLQSREVQKVGSSKTEPIDVRVVAATHHDLAEMVRKGQFREDLYYRLTTVEISLPALRERKEDLPMLFQRFVKLAAAEYDKDVKGISRRAQAALTRYSWPGNVRELLSAVSAACMMADRTFLDVEDLPERIRSAKTVEADAQDSDWLSLKDMQTRHAARVLESVQGNKLQAAKILGVSRTTLYKLIEEASAGEESEDLEPALAYG
ncbi:MAG: sigma-54-dependent Fis family transcriptional regulator [Acidobacteria bacterium]|nr:sigma-54-dependent Fis family transcriptional regulator [Acidobacteriota bacterium]